MAINAISAANTTFGQRTGTNSGNVELISKEKYQDFEVRTYETKGTTGKKWGTAAASLCLPGLGQAINSQWGKATAFFLAYAATCSITGTKLVKALLKNNITKAGMITAFVGSVTVLGLMIASAIDAFKSAKSQQTVITPTDSIE